jgi:GAF domain-containing protein
MATLVRELHDNDPTDVDDALDRLTRAAVDHIPGVTHAGITITNRGGGIDTPAGTTRYPALLDQIQQRHREGPCVEAAWEHHTVRVDDLAGDHRWPRYRRDALAQTPIRSVLSFEMFANDRTMGALNVYAEQPRAFDAASIDVGLVYATHAALAWNAVRREHQFRSALASRDIIGQAKGMLMERYDVDAVHAFDLLVRLSQESNTPLAAIAHKLVEAEHPSGHRAETPTGTS